MLREIETFLAVVRLGSFSAAGAVTGLTQSAVSAQIQRLEAALGMPLFDRVGRRVHLNPRGHATLPILQNIVQLFEEACAQSADTPVRGAIRIGAVASVHGPFLPMVLDRFRQRFPEVRVRVLPGVSWTLLNQVDADELALAIVIKPPMPLPLAVEWLTLWREPYVVVVSAASPVDDWRLALETRPFIRYDRTAFGGRQVQAFLHQHRIRVLDAFELDEFDAIEALVLSQDGVTLIPLIDATRLQQRGLKVLSLEHQTFYREVGIAARSGQQENGLARQLSAVLLSCAAENRDTRHTLQTGQTSPPPPAAPALP